MTRFGAFLRAVNVGGTAKLPMSDLHALCENCGFAQVKTYIASGNIALSSELDPSEVASQLEAALRQNVGLETVVHLRSSKALAEIAAQNPFQDAKGNQVTAILIHGTAEDALAQGIKGQGDEDIAAGDGVIYVHYPSGMARSKLRIVGAHTGTARNMNTIAKMATLTA